jgi:hypothetical protein
MKTELLRSSKILVFSVISADTDFCLERKNIRNGPTPYIKDA